MFAGGARSFSLYPLRVVYQPSDTLTAPAAILISVSKRRFKRAVDRNLLKRRIREAYRLHKPSLVETPALKQRPLAIAFIYLSPKIEPWHLIETRMKTALARIAEKSSRPVPPSTDSATSAQATNPAEA